MIERFVPMLMLWAGGALVLGGCTTGRLTTDAASLTGRSRKRPEPLMVHVGEDVAFTFTLLDSSGDRPISVITGSDYGLAQVGDRWIEMEADVSGRYRFSSQVEPGWADKEPVVVWAAAYRSRGRRDVIINRGQSIRSESPYDPSDRKVAEDKLRLQAYQSQVRLCLPKGVDAYDWATARLTIAGSEDRTSTVFVDRPPRRGFQVEQRAEGGCLVRYSPTIKQINRSGTTAVRLRVNLADGARFEKDVVLATP